MQKNKFPVIVLVKPQLPDNIGLSARAMMNCGFNELRIVNPREKWPNKIAKSSSAHGDFIIENAKVYKKFEDSISDLNFLIGTSARKRFVNKKHYKSFEILFKNTNFNLKTGIIFGPERSGLTNKEISVCDYIFSLPIYNNSSSLNLSHSVLIFCYEYNRLINNIKYKDFKDRTNIAPRRDFNLLMKHLKYELEKVGFLYPKEKAKNMFINIENMFIKSSFSAQEIRTFRGILKRLRNPKKINKDN